jgi:hypothetical protein
MATTSAPARQYPLVAAMNFSAAQNWTTYTKVHLSVKVVTADYSTLGWTAIYINGPSYNCFTNSGYSVDPKDGNWHAVTFSIAANDAGTQPCSGSVIQLGVQAGLNGTASADAGFLDADGGAFPQLTIYIDDVWVE